MKTDEQNTFPTWKKEPIRERYLRCIAVLYLNGLLSQSERDAVHKRLSKKIDRELIEDKGERKP